MVHLRRPVIHSSVTGDAATPLPLFFGWTIPRSCAGPPPAQATGAPAGARRNRSPISVTSHRRPKQPSRTRVSVLTTAAAAVALSANAAHAAPGEKLGKDEVKAKVDRLYEQAEQATEKYNGANDKQHKLQKEISTIQDSVARGRQELNRLR